MARCSLNGFDEMLKQLEGLADADSIVSEMLLMGAEVLVANTQAAIEDVADRGYATGELEASVTPSAPAKNAYGHYAYVYPVGIDSKGVRNGEKWGYLEHGNGGTQEPRPFEEDAVARSELRCPPAMQKVIDRYIK